MSAEVAGRLFDRLRPDGLTEHASTFARPDVLVALGAGLAGAGRTELEGLADRFLAERAVSVVADWALEERRWSTPDLLGRAAAGHGRHRPDRRTDRRASHQAVRDALAAHRPPAPISRRWSATCARAATASPWWWGGPGPARPSPWASPGMPGSWTATGSWPRPRPGSPP